MMNTVHEESNLMLKTLWPENLMYELDSREPRCNLVACPAENCKEIPASKKGEEFLAS